MNKSKLLEDIIKKAERLSRADGKSSVSADYFIAALLEISSFVGVNGSGVEDEAAVKAVREVRKIEKLLQPYKIDLDETAKRIKEELKEGNGCFPLSDFLFNKIGFTAESRAVKESEDEIGAHIYLELILSEPTFLINKYIINASETAACDALASFMLDEDENEGQEEPETQVEESVNDSPRVSRGKSDKNLTGLEKLLQSVDKAKSVQQKLLSVVYGQDQAVGALVSGYFQSELVALTQDKRTRPRATFLFAGPPGVGKTFLAEQAAEVLGLPYMRFDMSEYCEKESNLQFAGSDKVYKNGQPGKVTSFVDENSRCIILFDEVEKAHINVIHLFLQILDAGRLRDNYTGEEVSFADAILIFTTNAGRKLYEDPTITNLTSVSRKSVLKALSSDVNPETGAPLFPAAVCSRFASGNVIMFNHLDAHILLKIVDREISKHAKSFTRKTGIELTIDRNVPYAVMFSEGGKADARAIRGKSTNFLYQELYELFRLISSDKNKFDTKNIKSVTISVELPEDEKIRALFTERDDAEVLVFADGDTAKECKKLLKKNKAHFASTVEKAKEILFNNDISIILCDGKCGLKSTRGSVLNIEDVDSEGRDFFAYAKEFVNAPLYMLELTQGEVSDEERLSFSRDGARGIIAVKGDKNYDFAAEVRAVCNVAHQQKNLLELAKANKAVIYQTAQKMSDDGEHAEIALFDFKLTLAVDAEDNKNVLSSVSKPNIHFEDVIGAEDAKDELGYFVEYLKNPAKFMRSGVRMPRGVLLYGPPGTGKTLLAKAMAGESDVTFITAEGNQFLKKFVGEGPESVHELFNTARKYAPSILFVDEIDAIGKTREGGETGNAAAEVLTAFLTEMDGFNSKSDKPVFVLAATNFEIEGTGRSLDPALVRRFDNKILVDLPNKEERMRYIKMKAEKTPSMKVSDEEIENIAIRSTGMSLAELESVIELALRNAIKSKDFTVNDEVFGNAFEAFNSGEVKKWAASELERTARHEAGHALICWLGGETPSYLTIVARGSHGGYMQHGDSEDKGSYTKEDLLKRIRTSLGGRAAEVVYYGRDGLSTGASGDLTTATGIAEHMICSYGMDDEIGLGRVDLKTIAGSPYYAVIRDRVNALLKEEFLNAQELILKHRLGIDKLVEALMQKNHMKGEEIDEILSSVIKR